MLNTTALALEIKGDDEDSNAIVTKALEDLQKSVNDRLAAIETKAAANDNTKIVTRLDAMETKLNRPAIGGKAEEPNAAETKAFELFIRSGREAMSPDELKFLHVGDDTAGGYLVTDEFGTELLRNVVQFSPVRSVARVANTSAGAVLLPRRSGGMTSAWVGESSTRPETGVTFGQNRYTVREAACYVDVSNQMLEDAALDVAAELNFEFAEEFGRLEATAMVNGTGVSDLNGFMTSADVGFTVSGAAATVTADGLIDLYHAVPSAYRASAIWGMNSATMGAIRKLKDGNGAYLVTVAGLAGAPATTILGRPVIEMPDMPDIGAGLFPVIFGDFSMGYRIFDRVALSVIRDPFTQATTGKTRFHGRRRLAAGVAKAEALRKLKCSV